jgi:hypothetical protein
MTIFLDVDDDFRYNSVRCIQQKIQRESNISNTDDDSAEYRHLVPG